MGASLETSAANISKSIRVLVRVDRPGLDIYLGLPIFTDGAASPYVFVDRAPIGQISQLDAAGSFGSSHPIDHEICVMRNASIGMHMITLVPPGGTGAGRLGINFVRTRDSGGRRDDITNGSGLLELPQLAAELSLIVTTSTSNNVGTSDRMPVDRFLSSFYLKADAALSKGDFIVVGSVRVADASSSVVRAALAIGLHPTSGFLAVREIDGLSG